MNGIGRSEYRERSYALAVRNVGAVLRRGDEAVALAAPHRGRFEWLRQELSAAWAACGTFEIVALSYLGVSSALLLLFAENVAHPFRLLGTQAFVAAAILALCRKEARVMHRRTLPMRESVACSYALHRCAPRSQIKRGRDTSLAGGAATATRSERFWHFWRHWYPHLFFLFCFEEMGKLVHLVEPGWQDAKLLAFDHWLTGVTPSLWLERFAHPALNEFMQFAYFTYFLFLLVLGAILYHRREWRSYWAVMTYSAVGYSLGYVIATVFPVESPWFTLAGMWHTDLAGGPFTALISLIEKCGRVHGAAFPSQHVAGATAALLGAWRHRRWLFWTFLPLVICMDVSTVYVRNHYFADVLGGLVTGTLGYVIGTRIVRRSETSQSKYSMAAPV